MLSLHHLFKIVKITVHRMKVEVTPSPQEIFIFYDFLYIGSLKNDSHNTMSFF